MRCARHANHAEAAETRARVDVDGSPDACDLGCGADHGSCRRGVVGIEQVGRRVDFGVPVVDPAFSGAPESIARLSQHAAPAGDDGAVEQQQRRRVIGARLVVGIQQSPGVRVGIPDFGIHDRVPVAEIEAGRVAAHHEHVPGRQEDLVHEHAREVHRGGRRDGGSRAGDVDPAGIRDGGRI